MIFRFSSARLAFGLFTLALIVLACLAHPAQAGFRIKKIVDNYTPIPNGGGATFSPRGAPGTSGDWVIFDTGDLTIWRSTPSGKRLKKLITQDTPIPGGWGNFHQFFANYAQISGDTLVLVADACGGCGSGVGIFTRSLDGGPITKLVDRNDTNPTFPGDDKHFGGFGPDFRVGNGLVVFQNRQQVFSVPITGGPVTPIAGPQDSGFDPPEPFCCLFGSPSAKSGKVLLSAGNVFGRGSIQTVDTSGDPLSFRYVVVGGEHPPNTPVGYGFDNFEFWGPVFDQGIIFGGASAAPDKPPITGIYGKGSAGLLRLADSRQSVPAGTGDFFFSWNGTASPILASNGVVVFGARDLANKAGLYAVSEAGGKPRKIIAEGDAIGAFTVAGLEVTRASFDGSTLVFFVAYADFQGEGFYTTEVVLP